MQPWVAGSSASKWYNQCCTAHLGFCVFAAAAFTVFTLVTHVVLDWASRVEWNEQLGPHWWGDGNKVLPCHSSLWLGGGAQTWPGIWAKRPSRDYQKSLNEAKVIIEWWSPMDLSLIRVTRHDNWGIRWVDRWTTHESLKLLISKGSLRVNQDFVFWQVETGLGSLKLN